MSRYSEMAKEHASKIRSIKQRIDLYEAKHKGKTAEERMIGLIPLKQELIEHEIGLAKDYRAMISAGNNTDYVFTNLKNAQDQLRGDITLFQNDLLDIRGMYIDEQTDRMKKQYSSPLTHEEKVDKVLDTVDAQYFLFENIRLLIGLQKKRISFGYLIDDGTKDEDKKNAEQFLEKLRTRYDCAFDALFTYNTTQVKKLGIEEKTKHLLEIRKKLIEQGQEDKKKKMIAERPKTLQSICDKANRITGYTQLLDSEISRYEWIIEAEKEYQATIEDYYTKREEDMSRLQQEEDARYDPESVIPDEGFRDKEGNIYYRNNDDDERDI